MTLGAEIEPGPHWWKASSLTTRPTLPPIDLFTVVCLVAWPLNESEAGVDLVLIETSLLLLC